ncbi:MAG: protein translocase subunit SecF [Chloroflexota bacterium]
MFDITGKRFWFLRFSGIAILVCLIALAFLGLKPGVEFSSGSMLTVKFTGDVSQPQLEQTLIDLGYPEALVQQTQPTGNYIIRTHELSAEQQTALKDSLQEKVGSFTGDISFRRVSPLIASETSRTAAIAVAIAAIGILFYVTWAFRRMPRPFRYGMCAIIALVHDALIPLGIFAILGSILNWEINLMFITGVLAVIGYSVNNTVIIFDRVRENLILGVSADFSTVVNRSLLETMARSTNTAFTTLIAVLALSLFVGATIQNFAVVLIIGIIAGTYSSIFISPLLLVIWDRREWSRVIRWMRPGQRTA